MVAFRAALLAGLWIGGLSACGEDPLSTGGAGPTGATSATEACIPSGAPCRVLFSYPIGAEKSVELRGDFAPGAWEQGVPLTIDSGEWRVTLDIADGTTVRYKFFVDGTTYVSDPKNPEQEDDGFGGKNAVKRAACSNTSACAPTTSSSSSGVLPGAFDWRSAVMYFVFVDRFANGDPSNDAPVDGIETPANYQGGDYAGLLAQIEAGYFDALGVNALWLTVPMDNPSVAGPGADGHAYSAYHGYWPSNLETVEEHFGTEADLVAVVDAAHARGIKVLFDYAMNHVHASNPLVTEHPDWFWPLDFDGRHCVCGDGCAWDGQDGRRCWFRDYLPDWNFQNPTARAASIENAIGWIKRTKIDGFRLDAVKHIETVWIEDLRKRIDQEIDQTGGRFYLVGETFETGNRDAIRQYVAPNLLDGQFDFPLRGAIVENILRRSGTMRDLDGFVATNDTYYPGIMSTFIGNHDIARVMQTALDSPWGTWDNGGTSNWIDTPSLPTTRAPFERLALGFTFLFTTQGVPLVYYGDEIGMPGSGDPDNRRMMQLTGLDANQAWLLDRVKALGQLRKAHPALWKGTRTTLSVADDTYAFQMTAGPEVLYVAINRSDVPKSADNLPATSTDLLTGATVVGPSVIIPARTAYVLQ